MGALEQSGAGDEPPVACAVCERRRRRADAAAKVLGVLLIATVLALVTRLFPSWAASIQVANLLVGIVVAWLLARGAK